MLEPVEQRASHGTDDARLREVHMCIDEAWKKKSAPAIEGDRVWSGTADVGIVSACHHPAAADEQAAVLVTDHRPRIAGLEQEWILWCVEYRGSKDLGRVTHRAVERSIEYTAPRTR